VARAATGGAYVGIPGHEELITERVAGERVSAARGALPSGLRTLDGDRPCRAPLLISATIDITNEILASTYDARPIALMIPGDECFDDHQVHERAWVTVLDGEVEIKDQRRR